MSGTQKCLEVGPQCPVERSTLGYYPSLPANAFFLAAFATLFIANIPLAIRYKTWSYSAAVSLGCLGEVVGYAGRIMLHQNPFNSNGFIIQICCLIIAPAFNSAALYVTLKHLVIVFGDRWSVLSPRMYTYLFVAGDVISLVLQAVGGAFSSMAKGDQRKLTIGQNSMIAGVSWQVFTLFAFGTLLSVYIFRRWNAHKRQGLLIGPAASDLLHDVKFKLFFAGVITALLAIFIRCLYRIIEMVGGWGNPIMQDETGFIILEGVLIVTAAFAQTAFHPGYGFPAMAGAGRRGRGHGSDKTRYQPANQYPKFPEASTMELSYSTESVQSQRYDHPEARGYRNEYGNATANPDAREHLTVNPSRYSTYGS